MIFHVYITLPTRTLREKYPTQDIRQKILIPWVLITNLVILICKIFFR